MTSGDPRKTYRAEASLVFSVEETSAYLAKQAAAKKLRGLEDDAGFPDDINIEDIRIVHQ